MPRGRPIAENPSAARGPEPHRLEVKGQSLRAIDHGLHLGHEIGGQRIGVVGRIGTREIRSRHDPALRRLPDVEAGCHDEAVQKRRRRFEMGEKPCGRRHPETDANGVEKCRRCSTRRHDDLVGMEYAVIRHHAGDAPTVLVKPFDPAP